MVVAFGSFLFEDDRIVKVLGMGLASAVLLDVTLIRFLLVPATMDLHLVLRRSELGGLGSP